MYNDVSFCYITRPSERWISSTDGYKPHLALISAVIAREREREREKERERDKMRDNWSIRLKSSTSVI